MTSQKTRWHVAANIVTMRGREESSPLIQGNQDEGAENYQRRRNATVGLCFVAIFVMIVQEVNITHVLSSITNSTSDFAHLNCDFAELRSGVSNVAKLTTFFGNVEGVITDNAPVTLVNTNPYEEASDRSEDPKEERHAFWLHVYFGLGQIIGALLGGVLSDIQCGVLANRLLCLGVSVNSLASFLIPLVTWKQFWTFLLLRFFTGMAQGLLLPPINSLIAHTFSKQNKERNFMTVIICSGSVLGVFFWIPLANQVIVNAQWQNTFFLSGFLGMVWIGLFLICSFDGRLKTSEDPADEDEQPSELSLQHLEDSLRLADSLKNHLSNPYLYVAFIGHFGYGFGTMITLKQMPEYLSHAFNVVIEKLAYWPYHALPACFSLALFLLLAILTLLIQEPNSVRHFRRFCIGITQYGPALCLFAMTFVQCEEVATLILVLASVVCYKAFYLGIFASYVDMSTMHAGMLTGIGITISQIGSIAALLFAKQNYVAITHKEMIEAWKGLLLLTSGIHILANTAHFTLVEMPIKIFEDDLP